MLHQRVLPKDKVLFRLLKSKSSAASDICDKLNYNARNITLLSEDELCELWQYMKTILLEAQKLYRQASSTEEKYVKEYTVMNKLIRTITTMALLTITEKKFIPTVLLQNIMLLHSVVLPNIKDEQAKNEISHLLENWWKLDMALKEKVITNVLKYLIQNCKSSLKHIKRLYEIKSTIILLKCTEDVQELLKLVREKTVMSLEEGRMLILHLFTLGEQYILGIHNNVRVVLQNIEHNNISTYADLYITAWLNSTQKLKKFIAENCLQNIIFHCFRSYRDSTGRGQLGKNLLLFLAAMHDSKHQVARSMIHKQCEPLIWKHLKAPGSSIRCNAVEILFMTSSVQYTCIAKSRKKIYLEKYYMSISNLLKDTDFEVCNVTMNGLFKMLQKYWNCIPSNIIRSWLNIMLHHTKNASNAKIRANVFNGLKDMLLNKQSHRILKDFLPNFANSIYDDNRMVLETLIKLLWQAQNQLGMPFWDIVPLAYILHRLETTEDIFVLHELIKLVWVRISSNDEQYDKIKNEVAYMGMNNINAVRRVCFHSKIVISWDTSIKLVEAMLTAIKEEMERPSLTKVLRKNNNKKARISNMENNYDNDNTNICDEDSDSYADVQIYMDVIATLLIANVKNIEDEELHQGKVNILQAIAHEVPEFFKHFRETSVNESIIFLFSLVPPKFFLNKMDVIEMFIQQLCDPDTSDDTLLTIVYVLMKWNKGETLLFALTNLFLKSLKTNAQNQATVNDVEVFEINEKALELSLRILKHLLHVEHQSVLMNKYHKDILQFWETLHKLRILIEKELSNRYNRGSLIFKDVIVQFFKEYISMISLLHKKDVFDASEQFSEILTWVKRTLVPHMSCLDVNTIENHQTCADLIKSTLDIANLLLQEYNSTPKLCCDIVVLYCSCLSPVSGVIFFNNAFDAIMALLDFGKMSYEKREPNLLNIVVPNFICLTIITLGRYGKDTIIKHTNDMKILHELTEKYFSIIKSTCNDQNSYLSYVTIMFNTAISSISGEMTRILECSCITKEKLLISKLPYLAKKILKIILNKKKYQKFCIQVLSKTITCYTRIDMLSTLVVIHKIIKSSDKTVINRLKNVTLASKVYNQKLSCDTPFDRSINHAVNIVIDAILI